MTMECIFENIEALGFNEYIVCKEHGDILIKIYRAMRSNPLPGMTQPALNGSIMGMETILHVSKNGLAMPNCKWILYKNKKIQSGITNQIGMSHNLKIDLPIFKLSVYRLTLV